ncbi:TPA: type II toxin-antitoxin system HicB family antitoxin [Patescibacteria group bacterium]|nr:MAG: hypothetical protein UT71_C0005G0023 [Parcubacteria group bacterium GW2011_GWF2_40_10]KKR76664.1 MAG: hypothetical protein UU20_C0021G0008 [Parcubacteria group bacterium GW2011_GWE2_40_8]HBB56754.1 type II toxin-antitoxin system HicB family antitoxin [Patescibacteria group bacterium]HCI04603.1 type II toxin-antitoxin system HicB family antitoxin [Patescibacteria group bacterium]
MKKQIKNKVLSFSVIYEADPNGGYVAYVPSLSGCHSQGDNLEEAEKNIREAIGLYVESLRAHKYSIPQEQRILQGRVEISV